MSKENPFAFDLLLLLNLVQHKLSRMNINSLSLLNKTMQVTPEVMRILGGLLVREVTRDDPEWAAAISSLTVSDKVRIKPSRRQHEESEQDCRTVICFCGKSCELQSMTKKGPGILTFTKNPKKLVFGGKICGTSKSKFHCLLLH